MTSFKDLGLSPAITDALAKEGYEAPTPIQNKAIPPVLSGHDLLGIAQTGTGKTAAFALPILERLLTAPKRPAPGTCRALVLSPTRELAGQIAESFKVYGRNLKFSLAAVYGGVGYGAQRGSLSRGVDVLVATPGRLIDLMEEGTVRLNAVEVLVLDEADRMLDLGFVKPIRRILKTLPEKRKNLFFSATMPKEIEALAGDMLKAPVKVAVTPQATTVERVKQKVILIERTKKRDLLADLFADEAMTRAIVFTRTKRGADRVARHLADAGVAAAAIHGNKSQPQRERALKAFREGGIRALVATDIAARGIDVEKVSHVINFELPDVPESYVHRIGRTARAGAEGIAVSLVDGEERGLLRDIERVTRQAIPQEDRRGTIAGTAPTTERRAHEDHRGKPRSHGHRGKPAGRSDAPRRHEGQRHADAPRRHEGQHEGQRQQKQRQHPQNRQHQQPRQDARKPTAAAARPERAPNRSGSAKGQSRLDGRSLSFMTPVKRSGFLEA